MTIRDQTPDGDRQMSINEACNYADVGRATLYRWMNSGILPYHLKGMRRRVLLSDLQNALNRSPEVDDQEKNEEPELIAA